MSWTFFLMNFDARPVLIVLPLASGVDHERVYDHADLGGEDFIKHLQRLASLLLATDRSLGAAITKPKP